MRENDPMVDGEGAEHMRGLAVGESVEALPQRLSVDGDEAGRRGGAGNVETFRMTTKRLLEFVRIEWRGPPDHGSANPACRRHAGKSSTHPMVPRRRCADRAELAAKLTIPVNWLYVQIRKGRLLVDRQPSGAYLFNDTTNVLDGIQSLRTHTIDRLDLKICQAHQEGH